MWHRPAPSQLCGPVFTPAPTALYVCLLGAKRRGQGRVPAAAAAAASVCRRGWVGLRGALTGPHWDRIRSGRPRLHTDSGYMSRRTRKFIIENDMAIYMSYINQNFICFTQRIYPF